MVRSKLPALSLVLAIGTVATLTLFAATQKKVHPETGAGGPIRIAVVADHYRAAQEGEFDQDVENFFKYGLLEDPDFYKARAGDLHIETFFEAIAGSEVSKYGFTVGSGVSDCAVQWAADTTDKLVELTKGFAPEHIVVIGNYPYNFGCTSGEWSYLALDAVGTDVLPHEFGHALGELYDEWAPTPGKTGPSQEQTDIIDAKMNCAKDAGTAWWMTPFPSATNPPGCALYTDLVHPFTDCRMGATHHEMFCPVCRLQMTKAFDYLVNPDRENPDVTNPDPQNPDTQNPNQAARSYRPEFRIMNAVFREQPPGTPGTRPIFQLLVSFDPTKGVLTAKKGYFVTAPYKAKHRRGGGRLVYEFSEGDGPNNVILEVGVLPQQAFTSRSYRGGAQQHRVSDPQAADVLLQLPNVVEKDVQSRPLRLKIYRLASTVEQLNITPDVLMQLKNVKRATEVANLTTDMIRGAL